MGTRTGAFWAAVAAFAGISVSEARGQVVVPCNSLANAGSVVIDGNSRIMNGPCEVTLQNDLTILGINDGVLPLQPSETGTGGLVIHLNGRTLTLQDVNFTFDQGYAISVLGADAGNLSVSNVVIEDRLSASTDCSGPKEAQLKRRFGLIAHRVAAVNLSNLTIRGQGSNPATVQGGLMVVGDPTGAHGNVSWSTGSSKVRCGLAAASIRRPLSMTNVTVQSIGPCDYRPKDFSPVVNTGKP